MADVTEPGDMVERVRCGLGPMHGRASTYTRADGTVLCDFCGHPAAALAASGADRMREALEKGGFMMTEPKRTQSHPTARALVIGFQNGDDADDAMAAISAFMRANR